MSIAGGPLRFSEPYYTAVTTTIATILTSTVMYLCYDVLCVLLVAAPFTLLVAVNYYCCAMLLLLFLAVGYKGGRAGPCRCA